MKLFVIYLHREKESELSKCRVKGCVGRVCKTSKIKRNPKNSCREENGAK